MGSATNSTSGAVSTSSPTRLSPHFSSAKLQSSSSVLTSHSSSSIYVSTSGSSLRCSSGSKSSTTYLSSKRSLRAFGAMKHSSSLISSSSKSSSKGNASATTERNTERIPDELENHNSLSTYQQQELLNLPFLVKNYDFAKYVSLGLQKHKLRADKQQELLCILKQIKHLVFSENYVRVTTVTADKVQFEIERDELEKHIIASQHGEAYEHVSFFLADSPTKTG